MIFCNIRFSHANQCLQAINVVSKKSPVPKETITAIALTETGTKKNGRFTPSPWAINVEGRGFIFSSKEKAIATVKNYLKQGKKSIDIGCMQLNWRWHGHKFNHSVEKAFDPITNISVGSRYIYEHYKKYKNWHIAAGRYHSGTPEYAQAYRKKYYNNLVIARNNSNISQPNKPQNIIKSNHNKLANNNIKPQYPVYKIATLNRIPKKLFEAMPDNLERNNNQRTINRKTASIFNNNFALYNNLPTAPKPILDTARKRYLFQ